MASILCLSERGRIIPIARRLQVDGNIVKVWSKAGHEGLLEGSVNPTCIQNPLKMLEQFDLILVEPTTGEDAQKIQDTGKTVLGWNRVIGKLMLDKEYQQKACQFLGVTQGMIEGIQTRITGWVSQAGFSPLVMLSLPSYLMLEKNKGVKTEGMGSLVVYLQGEEKLKKLLMPFEELLTKSKYIGPFSLGVSIKGDLWSVYSIDSQLVPEDVLAGVELLKCSLFEFLFDLLVEGPKGKAWDQIGLSVTISIPPWPYLGDPIKVKYIEVPEEAKKHLSLGDTYHGVIGIASSRGMDVREARRRVYRTVENCTIRQECQYREDIGVGQELDLKALKEWGWV